MIDLFLNIVDFQEKISQSAFLEQFNSIVVDVPAEDMYYLLQTFASMAMARDTVDIDFIRCITTDLFKVSFLDQHFDHIKRTKTLFSFINQVGFVNALTRDNCYKIVRDLLVNITSKHTELISELLLLLRENFKVVSSNFFLLLKFATNSSENCIF